MAGKDHYYNKAKQEGYRSRAAYKLKQLDQLENVIDRGDTVVDLGAAPGGWLEVAAEAVGSEGNVMASTSSGSRTSRTTTTWRRSAGT